jgi:hypothetical protein
MHGVLMNTSSSLLALQPFAGIGLLHRLRRFFRYGVVSPAPNLQPGGPGIRLLVAPYPLTCLAGVALPEAYAPASIAQTKSPR